MVMSRSIREPAWKWSCSPSDSTSLRSTTTCTCYFERFPTSPTTSSDLRSNTHLEASERFRIEPPGESQPDEPRFDSARRRLQLDFDPARTVLGEGLVGFEGRSDRLALG